MLPPHIEAELARLGVIAPPAPSKPQPQYPTPWKPAHPGEEPPF